MMSHRNETGDVKVSTQIHAATGDLLPRTIRYHILRLENHDSCNYLQQVLPRVLCYQ